MAKRKRSTRNSVPKKPKLPNENSPLQNGLAQAIGFPGNGLVNFGQGFGGGNPWAPQISQANTIFENLRWYLISNFRQPLSQAYVELGLIQTVVDVPVDDALRGGIQIQSKQLDENQIQELQISLDRDDDLNTVGQAAKWNRLFGGAGVLIIVDDQDYEMPLDIASIKKDSTIEFRAVDMWELFWSTQNNAGYDPEIQTEEVDYYNYYGHQVHKSRVMRMKGLTAPSFIRPRLRGWGFSIVEILIRSINQYLKATDLAFACLDEFKVDVYGIKNLTSTLLSPDGGASIANRIAMANWQKNYQNALIMDGEDTWDHKQLSFAGLAETMQGIRMQVAADMRMPITKLFGTSASAGLGNTDQNDMENYNSMVESQVRNKIKYDILRVLELKCQLLFGFIPDDLQIEFKPLRVLSAIDEENVKNSIFNRALQAIQLKEISSKDFKDICNKSHLFPIQLDAQDDVLNPDSGNDVKEGHEDPDSPKDTEDPGANREDRRSLHVFEDQKVKPVSMMNEDQSEKDPSDDGFTLESEQDKPQGPIQAEDPEYEADYDVMAYQEIGGNDWIDQNQMSYFKYPTDKSLWEKSAAASMKYMKQDNEKYKIWYYRKKGGTFGDQEIKNSLWKRVFK